MVCTYVCMRFYLCPVNNYSKYSHVSPTPYVSIRSGYTVIKRDKINKILIFKTF